MAVTISEFYSAATPAAALWCARAPCVCEIVIIPDKQHSRASERACVIKKGKI